MSDKVIRVENISKKYIISHQGGASAGYKSFRESISNGAKSLAQKLLKPSGQQIVNPSSEEFWALRDVSFEIKEGDRVGIIGRNGAGKSTLLKILSRITEPTSGRIGINGQIASLLEVGTGFHPELTGRENIFLNGAILGMSQVEINRKFDEIVDFAEVEKFLDTPVKRYSSGMYVRLAFAVAAHLDPEILIVDEVLAVGDAQFQKKCLGKMEDVSVKGGRTVIFVSHNMGAVLGLTNKCIFLERGSISHEGKSEDCIAKYLSSNYGNGTKWKSDVVKSTPLQILECQVLGEKSSINEDLDVREKITIQIVYEVRQPLRGAVIAINIHASDGAHLISLEDIDRDKKLREYRQPGVYMAEAELPGMWLNSGRYLLRIGCGRPVAGESYDNIEALSFNLIETGDANARGYRAGYLLPMLPWKTRQLETNTSYLL